MIHSIVHDDHTKIYLFYRQTQSQIYGESNGDASPVRFWKFFTNSIGNSASNINKFRKLWKEHWNHILHIYIFIIFEVKPIYTYMT